MFVEKAGQHADAIISKLGRVKNEISVTTTAACCEAIQEGPWPVECRTRLVAAFMDASINLDGPGGDAVLAKTQCMDNPEEWLTAMQWMLMQDCNSSIPIKMELIAGHYVSLGIRHPSERMVQVCTAILLTCAHKEPLAVTTPHQRYFMNLDMKMHLKRIAKHVNIRHEIQHYKNPNDFKAKYPELWSRSMAMTLPQLARNRNIHKIQI